MRCYEVIVNIEIKCMEPKRPGYHPGDPAVEYREWVEGGTVLLYVWAETPERAAELAAEVDYGSAKFMDVERVTYRESDDDVTEEDAEIENVWDCYGKESRL